MEANVDAEARSGPGIHSGKIVLRDAVVDMQQR
jgi:hypothetical protein